jgi:chromate transporter
MVSKVAVNRLSDIAELFLRVGNTTFGGGDPTITALQRELVERRRSLSPEQFAMVYALARVTPGTNMLAFCAGAGWLLRGWRGAIVAVAAVTVPSSLLGILLLEAYERLLANPVAALAMGAMIAAAVGLMFAGAWLLARPHVTRSSWARTLLIASGAFLAAAMNWLSPLQVLVVAGVVGYFWGEPRKT